MPQRPVGVRDVFNFRQAIPRMSWSPKNLYNMWRRTAPQGDLYARTGHDGQLHGAKLYQERWNAKRLTKGYHADHLPSKKFGRWYLPQALPVMRHNSAKSDKRQNDLSKWVEGREAAGGRTEMNKRLAQLQKDGLSPVGTMMFAETERRLDVLIFRACFARSVWAARSYVVQGHVRLNGKLCRNPNTLLNPGDIFTVDPAMIPFINPRAPKEGEAAEKAEEDADEALANSENSDEPAAEAAESAAAESAESAETEGEGEKKEKKGKKDEKAEKVHAPGEYFKLPDYAQPFIFVPAYLLPSYLTCSAVYVRHPTARAAYSEIPSPYDAAGPLMSMTWEWYQKVAPRMRPARRARLLGPERKNDRK
ncbi:nam9 protein, precursor [Trichosporon asahii var. asahii CBS 2479]|uniref:Nam9 protein n=1 Tax=Trichosporon asahii var. asahii (strain ATCC 90039 / CBS 2479 / JCM 2466 / KCTC 7840 / NBRC 103889/ NCYC 2677 / UAMH 7654) TaxID=1186058 RepID=J6F688_TRIAS|nr:nam9 protein, precursor [Trichosporon asahii var. asahii CBS 2479]EJT50832.1 nam9 protein, precursor [Trichosporon asahii var. asahii CBS 2479]